MPLLSLIESARKVGWSIELIKYLTKNCPKHGEDRKLPSKKIGDDVFIEESDLLTYQHYLNEPWPVPDKKDRPPMREAIAEDVKAESHYECAICGRGDHNEVAHIIAVSDGECNSPDNLIFLCPNHHTAYDYGFKRGSNVSAEAVKAAKTVKRESRRRTLLHEANAAKAMHTIVQQLKRLEEKLKTIEDDQIRQVNMTEMKSLMTLVSKASAEAAAQAKKDQKYTATEAAMVKLAPSLAALAGSISKEDSDYKIRSSAKDVVDASSKVLFELNEVDCPRCGGRGQVGLSGRLCGYCGGSCFVTKEAAKEFDPDDLDEVSCPRCGGRGQTGWVGDICVFCKGDGFVTEEVAEEYDPDELDEVECPHCAGRGQKGWNNEPCSYCKGSCYVPRDKAAAFDADELDEAVCPRCNGSGQTGWVGDQCIYCRGNTFVTRQEQRDYDPDRLAEVDCPHCNAAGKIGWNNELCSYCKGSCFVSRTKSSAYDPEELDEESCPRCGGSGQTGLVGDSCGLCKGNCVVSRAIAEEYRRLHG